jgi:DNA repair protein RecO (recombination protein O)
MRIRDQGLCLRCTDWSETSQLVTLLCRDRGVVRGLAKGSKRLSPSSIAKFSGGFELLTGGELLATIKTGEGLATLTEWNLQQTYRHFRTELAAQKLGLYAGDVTQALLAENDPHPEVFDALTAFFEGLKKPAGSEDADEVPGEEVARQRMFALLEYQAFLLNQAGYRPVLSQDARTGQVLSETGPVSFDPEAGGMVLGTGANETTGLSARGPWRMRRETLGVLRRVFGELETTSGPVPGHDLVLRANRLLCVYVRAILDRELATMEIILGEGR